LPQADLKNWLEEHRTALERIARRAVELYANDPRIRVPRSPADRLNAFEAWLRFHREQLPPVIYDEVRSELAGLKSLGSTDPVAEAVDRIIWPEVESFLRSYAIRGHAAAWLSHKYRDTTTLGMPEPIGGRWRVPLGFLGVEGVLGEIVLEADGTIVEELTTSPEALGKTVARRP
jgi:hypothetical protein